MNLLLLSIWQKKVWRMNGSAKGLLMITTNLDGFSLVNRRRFAKLTKLSTCQTFLLYGILQPLITNSRNRNIDDLLDGIDVKD